MICVLGAGSWGTALATALARKSKDQIVTIWGRDLGVLADINQQHANSRYLPNIKLPANITATDDLAKLLAANQDILLAIPSHAFSEVLAAIAPHITTKHRLISATKGLDAATGNFLHQVVADKFGAEQKYALIAGPSFAMEVAKGLPTAITIAANDVGLANDLVNYLHGETLRVYTSKDLIGAQLGGILKNVLAVAAGIADGLNLGANARAALITRGLAELMRLGKALGANPETLTGLSGIGDLILTCTDNQSRNKRFGLALAAGNTVEQAQKEIGQVVESFYNIKQLQALAEKYQVDMPITNQVATVVAGKISPAEGARQLIMRDPKAE